MDDHEQNGSEDGAAGAVDKKNYKTILCQYYLQGPCKNGDTCSYAHGTSDLRTPKGTSLKDVTDTNMKRVKTKLCEKFLQYGACPFQEQCSFAHGLNDLSKALSAIDYQREASIEAKNNPSYKTALCQNYMNGHYCQFADKCQYAHGRHELRTRPPLNPSELSDATKSKLIAKAMSRPDYKTRLCQSYSQSQTCEYNDLCHFAHGEHELRKVDPDKANPFFKTVMCKKGDACENGDSCTFAHSSDELRPSPKNGAAPSGPNFKTVMCKYFSEGGTCPFASQCQYAHGRHELRSPSAMPSGPPMGYGFGGGGYGGGYNAYGYGYPGMPPAPNMQARAAAYANASNPRYKTQKCKDMESTGACPRGPTCSFAHNEMELRSLPNHKTSMCSSMTNTGTCPRGSSCNFAHSQSELSSARCSDPRYKTALCSSWKASGSCDRGAACIFAHGQDELRSKPPMMPQMAPMAPMPPMPHMPHTSFHNDYFGDGGGFGQSNFGKRKQQSNNHKRKTVLCQNYATFGECPFGELCSFAHSPSEIATAINKRQKV